MKIYRSERPEKAVYIQMRQVIRDKDGKLKVTNTKTITIHNATIEQVQELLEKK